MLFRSNTATNPHQVPPAATPSFVVPKWPEGHACLHMALVDLRNQQSCIALSLPQCLNAIGKAGSRKRTRIAVTTLPFLHKYDRRLVEQCIECYCSHGKHDGHQKWARTQGTRQVRVSSNASQRHLPNCTRLFRHRGSRAIRLC